MTRKSGSIPDSYFETLYARDRDPWRFASSDYERLKYAATLSAIGTAPIRRAWEVGCSIGVFTRALGAICDDLLAIDVAETALTEARRRCADLPHIRLRRLRVPDEWPAGCFDLIVFSEVLYYLSPKDIEQTARQTLASLSPQGRVVLVHWTGETDYPCTGDQAADLFGQFCGNRLATVRHDRAAAYRLDVFQADISSV